MEFVEKRMRNYAYLNTGLTPSRSTGRTSPPRTASWTCSRTRWARTLLYEVGYWRGDKIEFAFTHTDNYGEEYFSFVNGQYTSDGGTHLSAFREGFLKAVNEFFQASYRGRGRARGHSRGHRHQAQEPAVREPDQEQAGQRARSRPWIIQEVKRGVDDYLRRNPAGRQAPPGEDRHQREAPHRTQHRQEGSQGGGQEDRAQDPQPQGLQVPPRATAGQRRRDHDLPDRGPVGRGLHGQRAGRLHPGHLQPARQAGEHVRARSARPSTRTRSSTT